MNDGNETARAAARGVIAAMAMTGMRRMTTGLGLVQEPPPEELAKDAPLFARLVRRTPPERQDELVELFHWLYGGAAGAAFGLLVRSRRPWVGPAYGLAIWAIFETGVVPILGLDDDRERTLVSRIFVALDHVLYGIVVAGEPASPKRSLDG
ncbi:hypothetical protein BH18ACT13_BH18ACT13_03560 [soil metagenome]